MIDRIELKKTWDLFVGVDGFTEVRILGRFQYSGYFKSIDIHHEEHGGMQWLYVECKTTIITYSKSIIVKSPLNNEE